MGLQRHQRGLRDVALGYEDEPEDDACLPPHRGAIEDRDGVQGDGRVDPRKLQVKSAVSCAVGVSQIIERPPHRDLERACRLDTEGRGVTLRELKAHGHPDARQVMLAHPCGQKTVEVERHHVDAARRHLRHPPILDLLVHGSLGGCS